MFGKLREKFKGWFGKKEEKAEEKPKKKAKPKKEVKEEKKKAEAEKIVEEVKKGKLEEVLPEEQDEEALEEEVKELAEEIKGEKELEGKMPARPPAAVKEKKIEKEVSCPPAPTAKEKKDTKQEKEESILPARTDETPKEELKEELEPEEKQGFFGKLKKKLLTSELKQEQFDELFEELEEVLLENNVALGVVDKIRESLSKDLVGAAVKKSEVEGKIKESLKNSIMDILVEGDDLIEKVKDVKGPYVILFFGINGSGKTTSVAKLAHKLKSSGVSCVLAAADTFRAASIEQLEKHAAKVGVPIVKGEYGKDPSAVAFDAIAYAKKHKIKVVLIDTAGRMYTKTNLMKEMEKIVRVSKPNLKIFVGESITGNDATEQAKMFHETAGIDGIILTKADVDEKAGAILSVGFVTGKPVLFLGVGQKYEDLERFEKSKVLEGLGLD